MDYALRSRNRSTSRPSRSPGDVQAVFKALPQMLKTISRLEKLAAAFGAFSKLG